MTGEMVRNIVLEDENELELKEYLHKIENIFGTEYAVACLSSNVDMGRSIDIYSSKFLHLNNSKISFILIKSYILSNKGDDLTKLIVSHIYHENISELLDIIKGNLYIRKRLIRNFIEQKKDNQKLYKISSDKNYIYETLSELKFSERNLYLRSEYNNRNNFIYQRKKR